MKNLGYIAFVLFIMVLAVACSNGGIGGGPSIQYYAVTGHVLDADYQGLANVKVSAVYDGGMVEAVTELDGTFAFEDLHGEVEIQGPEVEGKRTLPAFREVTSERNDVDFVVHQIQAYDEDSTLPDTQVLVYDEVVLDFSSTSVDSETTVRVTAAAIGPGQNMVATGPVIQVEVSSEFSGKALLQLTTDAPDNSGLFRYDPEEGVWNTVIDASYVDGSIVAELPNFSTYGVFSAPRADAPSADPEPGSYIPGTAIQLFGDTLFFTTDGTEPNGSSTIYDALDRPILGQEDLVITAFNVLPNHRVSETVQFQFTVRDPETFHYISGPKFVTLSGRNTRFDFDTGQVTEDISTADVRFTAVQYGGEFTAISFRNFSGTWFRPDGMEVWENPEAAYHYYRTVGESDWQADDPFDMGSLRKRDTLLLKTSGGRFVKVFIIDTRGHFNHDDRPAVDFVYHFTDEIDIEAPVLEQVTVITVEGQEVSQPFSNIIEFELASEPEFLVLDFNEIVYRNRGLLQEQEDSPVSEDFRYSVWWSYASPRYYLRPSQSDQFRGRIWGLHPDFGTVILTEGDDYSDYENDAFTDQGYYFSDLLGNRWTELPFEKISISFETDDD